MTDDLNDVINAANDAARIERLTHHIYRIREGMVEMRDGMKEMRDSLKQMAEAINRLAVIEERQNQDRAALERAFGAIETIQEKHDKSTQRVMELCEKIETRVMTLERAEESNKQVRTWFFGAVGAAGLALLYAVFRVIGVDR